MEDEKFMKRQAGALCQRKGDGERENAFTLILS